MILDNKTDRIIYTVSQLNGAVREILEDCFPTIWLEGEISNLSTPSSGHIYFTLKDAHAQVRCAMFRNRNRGLPFKPEDGTHVVVKACVSLYETRGDYQLIVESMEHGGDGALQRKFEILKEKLLKEGLFETIHKKEVPEIPKQIGVITSATGAAIRDILIVLKRRFPTLPVIIYPTQVQGSAAASQIVQALKTAQQRQECDVLILARGGGSLEDLWPFNEEIVARAIFQCDIPIITGIGHEVDVTIADFVADHRAPTPSAAAEYATPDQNEWLAQFKQTTKRLQSCINQILQKQQHHLQHLTKRLRHPGDRLRELAQRIDFNEQAFQRCISIIIHKLQHAINTLHLNLQQHNPKSLLIKYQEQQASLNHRLQQAMVQNLQNKQEQWQQLARALNTVSPLATLERGYSLTTTVDTGEIIRDSHQLAVGDKIKTQLGHGSILCTVEQCNEEIS